MSKTIIQIKKITFKLFKGGNTTIGSFVFFRTLPTTSLPLVLSELSF